MIRRLLARLLPGGGARNGKARVYGPGDHPIRRDQLSTGALQVCTRLHDAGFKGFVVGGAVRDLLLGFEPKDFDIATDAHPEQVKPLFRRAFLIGRRFRLVHVHVGSETVEVSTFRAPQTGDDATDEHGRLLTDNVYGTQAEDAARRDFTINALYFDPATEEVWDYVGGVADIRARRLRLIGPPTTRFREDPVRMLRAVRLAAKLGVAIDPKTAAPIPKLASLMANVPPARLFDEMQKLLLSGHAVETLRSLRAHGLSHGLLPLLDVIVEQPLGQRFIDLALANTDERVGSGRPVSPGFLFATLLWHQVLATWNAAKQRGRSADPRAVRGDGSGAGAASAAARHSSPIRSDDQGDLVAAAAVRAARGQPSAAPARASPLPGRVGFPGPALPQRRTRRRARIARPVVGRLRQCRARGARVDAQARRSAPAQAPLALARPQGARRSARRVSGPACGAGTGVGVNAITAFVGLGSNLQHPRRQLARALAALRRLPGTRLVAVSPNYASAPIGCADDQPDYVNAVARIATSLAPRALLARLHAIERRQRRARHGGEPRNQPRTLDLDLLLYGRRRMHLPQLTVPHPRMHQRAFVLRPLADLAPRVRIPGHGPARMLLAGARHQRIARTRTHHLR